MKADRAVVETNELISAALRAEGQPRGVLDVIRRCYGVLLFSDETSRGLRSRLRHPKFDRYVSQTIRAVYPAQLMAVSEWVSTTNAKLGCRDPDDDKFLETALMGDADCIITGDRSLLEMSPFHGISILPPSDFLNRTGN